MTFHSNLFKLLTANIAAGPEYVESIFEKLVGLPVGASETERYLAYIDYLQTNQGKAKKPHYNKVAFLFGYLNEQTALHTGKKTKDSYKELAFAYYQDFLSFGKACPDTRYYAMWKSGKMQEALGTPWSKVLVTYQSTLELDPIRGEAVGEIIDHYFTASEWRIAYQFSSYCKRVFLNNNPAGLRKWQVNPAFYDWKILDYHVPVCVALRKREEAKETYGALCKFVAAHSDDFSPADIGRIRQYQALIEGKPSRSVASNPKLSITHPQPTIHETVLSQLHL